MYSVYYYEIATAGYDAPTERYVVSHHNDFSDEQFEEMILEVVPQAIAHAKEIANDRFQARRERLEKSHNKVFAKDIVILAEHLTLDELCEGIQQALHDKYGFEIIKSHRIYALDAYFNPFRPVFDKDCLFLKGNEQNADLQRHHKLHSCVQEVLKKED